MARIAVVGAGYAGVGTAVALGRKGHRVTCVDKDAERADRLRSGRSPFFEKGLDGALKSLVTSGRLRASTETPAVVRESDAIVLCVGTPSLPDGTQDTSQVQAAAAAVGEGLRRNPRQLVVVKSTVLPGTTEGRVIPTLEAKSGLRRGEFGVCVNPEFLREGQILEDSLRPSHIVVGELDRASGNSLLRIYASFRCPKIRTSLRVAETIKYATNAFLATKVTFANELANLCTRLGLDVDEVLAGAALDPRIGSGHLQPGVGFGGSCLPKDLRAVVRLANEQGYDPVLLASVLRVNERQHMEVIRLLEAEIGGLRGKRIAVLGLSFKPGTDDIRESKARDIVAELRSRDAIVVAYDPRAGAAFKRAFPEVEIASSLREALRDAEACVVQTSWPEFSRLGEADFVAMREPVVIDGRRTWPSRRVPHGIRYRRIG